MTHANSVEKLLSNGLIKVALMLGIAGGAVVAIAGGFVTAYQVVTWLGN